VGSGAIPVIGINGLNSPPEIQNLNPGISIPVLKLFWRDIAPGVAIVAGAKPPRTSMKIRSLIEHFIPGLPQEKRLQKLIYFHLVNVQG
jgi:hypothetical protein